MSQPNNVTVTAPSNVSAAPPSNAQVVDKLDSTAQVLKHEKETNPHLDQRGRDLATTAENLIQTSKELIQDKNEDEKFQKFVTHCMSFGEKLKAQKGQHASNVEFQKSMDQLTMLSGSFRNLIKQIVMSAEYRSMFMQLIETIDRIFWGVAHRTNAKKSTDPQALLQGTQHQHQQNPVQPVQAIHPGGLQTIHSTQQAPVQGGAIAQNTFTQQAPTGTHTGAFESQSSHVATQGQDQQLTGHQDQQSTGHQGQQSTGQQASDALQAVQNTGQQMANEISEEEKREVAHQLLTILSKMGKNPEWHEASNNMLSLFDFFREQAQQGKAELGSDLKEEMRQLYHEGTVVVQDMAGLKDLTPLQNKFWALYKTLNEDQESRKYFHELREFVNRVLSHPESVDDQQVIDESSRLSNQGSTLIRSKYSHQLKDITTEFKSILNSLQTNEYSRQYQQHMTAFQETIRASPFETLSQARHLMFPLIRELMNEFPLPRVEGTTENGTYTIDNMVLQGRQLNLDDIIVDMRFGLKDVMVLTLRIKGISAGIKNGNFTYNSTGMMSWNDAGTFDVNIASPEWKIKWMVVERNNQPMRLEISKVDVRLRTFNITIEEAKHKILDRMFLGLFTTTLRKKAEDALESSIRKQAATSGDKFNSMFFPTKKAHENQALPSGSAQSMNSSHHTGSHSGSPTISAPFAVEHHSHVADPSKHSQAQHFDNNKVHVTPAEVQPHY